MSNLMGIQVQAEPDGSIQLGGETKGRLDALPSTEDSVNIQYTINEGVDQSLLKFSADVYYCLVRDRIYIHMSFI